jgi:hypothetical protein
MHKEIFLHCLVESGVIFKDTNGDYLCGYREDIPLNKYLDEAYGLLEAHLVSFFSTEE